MDEAVSGVKRASISHALGGGKRPKLMTPNKNRRLSSDEIVEADTPIVARSSMRSNFLSSPHPASTLELKSSIFNDPIHGNIQMNGLCLRIIDTKEFQRLRELKQLGVCDFVYPGATHTRFSHSIGVAHFAERVIRTLMLNQPELQVTEEDLLCVKVAGLCHDLGHGPFSHVFDGVFMHRARPNDHWRHEDWSVSIFEHLLVQNQIDLSVYGLSDIDRIFITEIIRGTKNQDRIGRSKEKFFLYDIVNNSRSGLDVDKLDYFQRDIRHTNVDATYNDFQRFVEFGRVMKAEPIHPQKRSSSGQSTAGHFSHLFPTQDQENSGDDTYEYMICYPEKMVNEAVQLFALRFQLHQKVYTHRTVKKVEYMLVDAMVEADPYILIPGTKSEKFPDGLYRMSQCVEDPAALSNLNDSVIYLIETSIQPELKKAQDILQRIRRREFYDCLGKTFYKRGSKADRSSERELIDALLCCAADIQDRIRQNLPIEIDDNTARYANNSSGNGNVHAIMSPAQSFEMFSRNDVVMIDDMIFSQDSFAPSMMARTLQHSQNLSRVSTVTSTQGSNGSHPLEHLLDIELLADDIIVEKMHIHYGLKSENPVSRLRFFQKGVAPNSQHQIAQPMKEAQYETVLPRVFEELAIRVFCRDSQKTKLVMKAFEKWCRDQLFPSPVLALSQMNEC